MRPASFDCFNYLLKSRGCSSILCRQGIQIISSNFSLVSHIRDVSSVELLQKYHQGIRAEIEARGAKFTECADLGKALLTRKHRDSAEVRPRLFVPHRAPDHCFHQI